MAAFPGDEVPPPQQPVRQHVTNHNPPLSLSSCYQAEEHSVTAGLDQVQSGEAFAQGYELGKVVGRGAFSVVRLARRRVNGQVYASKIINKMAVVKKKRLRDEIRILVSIRHDNVVALREIFETQRELLLVMDLATGGELFDRIVQKEKYSEREASEVMAQLLAAVCFLHQQNVIHRDIKPENILLANTESDTNIKLSDFGLAKLFEADTDDEEMDIDRASMAGGGRMRAYTNCGTDYYVAPEVLRGEGYDSQVDMWSVGVVMYILLCGFPPFFDEDGDMSVVYHRIKNGIFDFPSPYWDTVSDVAKDLVRRLLTVDPELRASGEIASNHPWIATRKARLSTDKPISPHYTAMFRKFNKKRKGEE